MYFLYKQSRTERFGIFFLRYGKKTDILAPTFNQQVALWIYKTH